MDETRQPYNQTATAAVIKATMSNINKEIQSCLWLVLHLTCLNTALLENQPLC